MTGISYSIGFLVIIIPLLFLFSVTVNPIYGQEDDQPIEPIPPANVTNQTSSQISTEIDDPILLN